MSGILLRTFTLILLHILLKLSGLNAQYAQVCFRIYSDSIKVREATVMISGNSRKFLTDSNGSVCISLKSGSEIEFSCLAFSHETYSGRFRAETDTVISIHLSRNAGTFREFVVTGTMRNLRRSESPVNVEVYSGNFFKKNPTPNIFEALQNINGVRPQLNCNICNTGDIHINGLEGPYTMILIDGMPIVSSLSTVYGLSGIPNSMVERIEIVRGPASSLYGSEAVGGLINVITKQPERSPRFSSEIFASGWGETNIDLSHTMKVAPKLAVLSGLNVFFFNRPVDKNKDGFTDVTLQKRMSFFQKWSVARKNHRVFTVGTRIYGEDRWGGQENWTPAFRGSDSIYGENILTTRAELISRYQLPGPEKIFLSVSWNAHRQKSWYGTTPFHAEQYTSFAQLTWEKKAGNHELLAGLTFRHTWYDDNTPVTRRFTDSSNAPSVTPLPGIFIQDEYRVKPATILLMGLRSDYHPLHGTILTPRIAIKHELSKLHSVRLNFGTGFRVVNVFTEDHAALTGARDVVIEETLRPERSSNVNLNYLGRILLARKHLFTFDISAFYNHFSNRIIADYESDVNKILYSNLLGYAISKGINFQMEYSTGRRFRALIGATCMDVFSVNAGIRTRQMLTEQFSGTWALTYQFTRSGITFDYTGNLYGPMKLPVLGPLDPRKPVSPWWSIQNIQVSMQTSSRIRIFGGVKNLLNWTPDRNNPFLIARSHDPFDKKVVTASNGQVMSTPENPYALTFDPNYVYAPNQGRRIFLGFSYSIPNKKYDAKIRRKNKK